MNGPNGKARSATAREERSGQVSGWDLPQLVRPLGLQRARQRPDRRPLRPIHLAVLEFIWEQRFATGSQVMRRFARHLRTQRTTQRHLARLVSQGHLAVCPVRSTAPHFPHVFQPTGRGLRLLRETWEQYGIERPAFAAEERKQRGRGLNSILHELLLTEFAVGLHQSVGGRGDLEILERERRFYRRDRKLRYEAHGRPGTIIPDAGFLLAHRQGSERHLLWHLVELDNGTMSVKRIREKLQRYQRWSASLEGKQYCTEVYSRHGQPERKPNFRLLIIAHDSRAAGDDRARLATMLSEAARLSAAMRRRIWLTNAAQLRERQNRRRPLAAPLWLRVRDVPKSIALPHPRRSYRTNVFRHVHRHRIFPIAH